MTKSAEKGKTMKNLLLLSLLLGGVVLVSCNNDNQDEPTNPIDPTDDEVFFAVDVGTSEIPYVVINTNGNQIQNEPKVPATIQIFEKGELKQATTIGIEFRGSTSFRLSDKKSFGIESWDADGNDQDVTFFGMPEEEDWILNGHVVNESQGFIWDRTLMYHYIGYNLYRQMGRYASRTQFVELQVNGEYLGVYVFMEKLKRDNERIDISRLGPDVQEGDDLTGGYILKIDKTAGGDVVSNQPLEYFLTNWEDDARYLPALSFRSSYDIFGNTINFAPYGSPYHSQMFLETYFIYEYPKAEDLNDAQKNYIQNYIHSFETALLNDDFSSETRTYTDYIDISSFVDHFILNELVRNIDGYRLSTFLVKPRNGKLEMGPVWDLNIGFDSNDRVPADDWIINYNNHVSNDPWMMPFWWPRLIEDPVFTDALKTRWSELRSGPLADANFLALVDESADYLQSNGAVTRNYSKWNRIQVDYQASIQSLRDFLVARASWMDSEIASF